MTKTQKQVKLSTMNICPYCEKQFARDTSMAKHSCERKRRYLAKDEPASRLGFLAFCKFWEIHHRGNKQTIDAFIRSPYYLAFRKFGLYCVDIRALNVEALTRWLLKNNHAIDRWCSDRLYTEWMTEYLRIEPVTDALMRSIEYSVDWEKDTGMKANDLLRYANTSRLILAISTGRLSPWCIYCAETGQNWLTKLQAEELKLIWDYVNPDDWNQILLDRREDRVYTTEILTKAGW